jgi:hypothetical protein
MPSEYDMIFSKLPIDFFVKYAGRCSACKVRGAGSRVKEYSWTRQERRRT